MRSDMPEKFLEPSSGRIGRFPRHSKKVIPKGEDGITEIPINSMMRLHIMVNSHSSKDIGTNFRLLSRFLKSHVGKPWNEVYSEICQHADYRSYKGHHLRDWLKILVEQNCFINDGIVVDQYGFQLGYFSTDFYVHPETRNLELIEHHRQKPVPNEKTVFEMGEFLYHEHEGIWYRTMFKPLPKDTFGIVDVFVGCISPYGKTDKWFLKNKYGPDVSGLRYCYWKQSANHNEIQKLKSKFKKSA